MSADLNAELIGLLEPALRAADFAGALFSGQRRNLPPPPWRRVAIRPVMIGDRRHWQFNYFDERRAVAKNADADTLATLLSATVAAGFRHFMARTASETLHVDLTRRDRPMVRREARIHPASSPDVTHDRAKPGLPGDAAPDFLKVLGVSDAAGRIKPAMRTKHRQVCEFLRVLGDVCPDNLADGCDSTPDGALAVVDLGCGNALLTFAAYHYFKVVRGWPVSMTGVDQRADLLARHAALAGELGWAGLRFVTDAIGAYRPMRPPAVVLALHACDTATDDAIVRTLEWGSRVIILAPCCHHYLQARLADQPAPEAQAPLWRDGLLRERQADLLTDACRALWLRGMGYRTDVLEFVDNAHTPRNLMIRAVLGTQAPALGLQDEYRRFCSHWGVAPYLESALRILRAGGRAESPIIAARLATWLDQIPEPSMKNSDIRSSTASSLAPSTVTSSDVPLVAPSVNSCSTEQPSA